MPEGIFVQMKGGNKMYVPLVKLYMIKEKELPYAKEIIDNPKKVAKGRGFVKQLF